MGRMGVLITWSEITGHKPTKYALHRQLQPYSLQSVLLGLARLSALINTWQIRYNPEADLDIARQALPKHYQAIKQLASQRPDHRVLVGRISILYVAKQALKTCPLDGTTPGCQSDVQRIMECCLMANDLLLERPPDPRDLDIDKAVSLLPFSNYLPHADDPLDIARNLILVEKVAPEFASRPDYRDLASEFHSATGLQPRTFCELVYASATKFLTRPGDGGDVNAFILTPEYFARTKARDLALSFLGEYSVSLARIRAAAQSSVTPESDFLIFQRHPLIEFAPNNHLCIDPGFLLEKAGRSFYWTLHAKTPATQQKHLLGYWSKVVEKYVQQLAQTTYAGRGTLIDSPVFADGDEACDVMIREGTDLVLVEIKASTLTAKAKYSFDSDLLFQELWAKAIYGEKEERKGIGQLHRTVQRFQSGEAIAGIKSDQVSTIYPVIAFLDESFLSPYCVRLYRKHFDRDSLARRPRVLAPYAISIRDLEDILPHTPRHNLADIFDEYYQHNRVGGGNLAFGSFRYANVPKLRGDPKVHSPIEERFKQFHDDLISNMFDLGSHDGKCQP